MNQPMTHREFHKYSPFTVVDVQINAIEFLINITLSSPQGYYMTWWSSSEWILLTPDKNYLSVEEDTETIESLLTGMTLTSVSGYENFYNNTLIFNHEYILRNITTEDDWGEGWGVQLDIDDQQFTSLWITPSEQNKLFLPLPFNTSLENPYDICSTPQNTLLVSCVSQRITAVNVEVPTFIKHKEEISESAIISYILSLKLENKFSIDISSYWCISSEDVVIAYQGRHRPQVYSQISNMADCLIGRRVLGFGGNDDLLDATIFFDNGLRIDQIQPFCKLSDEPGSVGWSVYDSSTCFSRKGLQY